MAYTPKNPNGSATSANSSPVVIASDQAAVAVSVATVPSHAVTNAGTFAVQATEADGANTTLGAKADAKSTATDTTAVSAMSVLKQISASVQAPPSQAVTNAGTFVTQVDGAALTSLQLIDDVVYTDDTSTHATGTSKGVGMMAAATPTDGSVNANDIGMVAMTTDRRLLVDASGVAVPVTDNSGSLTVDYATTGSGTATGALRVELPTNGTGVIATVSAVTAITNALPAGTNAIGKLAANSGVDIGDVDVISLTGSSIAHDAADSGNPHKIGFKAYSPDGTTPGTAVAEADRTDAKADLDGRQYVNDEHPRWWSYHVDGSSALTDASVQADPGDGFQIVITDIIFSLGAATAINMFLEEGASKILGPIYLEAINGRGFVWKGTKHVTASTAVTITTSAAVAHSVDIMGYIQAV